MRAVARSSHAPALLDVGALIADYWFDVDHHCGRGASQLYTADGVFAIGDERMEGPEAVHAFYSWRESRGTRQARHVVSNLRVCAATPDRATVDAIMCLYAADGMPVLPSKPPILIADVKAECVRAADGQWYFKSHLLLPVFAGGVPITVPSGAEK